MEVSEGGGGGGARREETFEIGGFPMFLQKKRFGNKNNLGKKNNNLKSQYSSVGLAALPEPPNHGNHLQLFHFAGKATVFFTKCSQFRETFWSRPKVTPTLAG